MKPLATSLAVFAIVPLLGASPSIDCVPTGVFRTWGIHPMAPLRFASGGVVVEVAARPCPMPADTEGCRYEGTNNQAEITVRSPGLPPFRRSSDRHASFVRAAVVRLDRRASRAGVVIDNQWGGSAGVTAVTVIEPLAGGFRAVPLRWHPDGVQLEGELADRPRDRSGDGVVDFVLRDARFDGAYGCNACSPRPPIVLSAVDGRSVDLSARRSVRAVFAANIASVRATCRSHRRNRNGNCAAYLADAARLGRFGTAWRDMLVHYERHSQFALWQGCTAPLGGGRCPLGKKTQYRSFPESVRAYLVHTGYLAPARAAAAPLS